MDDVGILEKDHHVWSRSLAFSLTIRWVLIRALSLHLSFHRLALPQFGGRALGSAGRAAARSFSVS